MAVAHNSVVSLPFFFFPGYTRVLEFGVKLAAVGMCVAVFLIPVYFTAPTSVETEGITDSVVKMSTTNVPSGDLRFLATVLAAYVVFGYAMMVMKILRAYA